MKTTVVRYTVRPEFADENERLIREVFAELARDLPKGMRYQSFQLEDGVSFLHIATFDETQAGSNPLRAVAAFQEFQERIGERCAIRPVATPATLIGDYRD